MFTSRFLTKVATVMTILIMTLSSVQPAYAAPPTNDNFDFATIIGALPFSDAVDNTEATTEAGEPQYCISQAHTVWYSFTPTSPIAVRADTSGSSFGDTTLTVYQAVGSGFGGLSELICTYSGGSVTFNAQANTTYYLQAGSTGGYGDLHVNLQEFPPPANNDFANATPIPSLPFDDAVDTSAAGIETGEPTPSCAYYGLMNTAWYAFTPGTSGSISASVSGANFTPMLAVYTGNSLTSLTEVACQPYGNILTFHADAGTIYYLQVGVFYPWQQGSPMQFHLDVTPAPVAQFFFSPSNPSIFDNIQFYDQSYDPGQVGFRSFAWDFGDGATSADQYPTHRYVTDGDYTVQHSVTTYDGRSASTSQVVQVRTHDIAINKLVVPQTARVNQTKAINVDIKNKRYSENIQVNLYKGLPGGGEQLIGTLTLYVPARATRPTTFKFSYTFTAADATVGKVTFRAEASIVGASDALPSDNNAIATTLVTK